MAGQRYRCCDGDLVRNGDHDQTITDHQALPPRAMSPQPFSRHRLSGPVYEQRPAQSPRLGYQHPLAAQLLCLSKDSFATDTPSPEQLVCLSDTSVRTFSIATLTTLPVSACVSLECARPCRSLHALSITCAHPSRNSLSLSRRSSALDYRAIDVVLRNSHLVSKQTCMHSYPYVMSCSRSLTGRCPLRAHL